MADGLDLDLLGREIARARRFGRPLSLLDAELDGDGEDATALVLAAGIRAIDVVARLDAARLVLILPETERLGAFHLANRLGARIRESSGRALGGGIATFPQDAGDAAELARRAGEALGIARARGAGEIALHHAERRRHVRLPADDEDLQATLLPEGSRASLQGWIRDISCGGLLFAAGATLEPGHGVQVLIRSRLEPDQIVIPGRVARLVPRSEEGAEPPRYDVGVAFALDAADQIEGVVDFLERFTAAGLGSDPPGAP